MNFSPPTEQVSLQLGKTLAGRTGGEFSRLATDPLNQQTVNGEQLRSFNWILPNRLLNSIISNCSRNSGKPGVDRQAMNFPRVVQKSRQF
jgi:hypothetical protein